MAKKTIYYSDSSKDDFSGINILARIVDENFKFLHKSLIWKGASFFLYYCFVLPLVFIIDKIWYGIRFKNRKALKKCGDSFFLYGNHTQYFADATCPALLSFPKRAYVIAGADAVSIKGIGWLVQMLGGLILHNVPSGRNAFRNAVSEVCKKKCSITIYPEAHIWPYYTGIREFSPASFIYPVTNRRPVAAIVTTYRKRLFKFLPPAITVYVSDLFYPDTLLDENEARLKLRDRRKMCRFHPEGCRCKSYQAVCLRRHREQDSEMF